MIAFQIIITSALVGFLLYHLIRIIRKYTPEIAERTEKEMRRSVADVKPGELVTIEWSRIKGKIGQLKCLSNDPIKKVILLEIHWGNWQETGDLQYEKLVLNYSDTHLANFHLLNSDRPAKPRTLQEKLQEEMDELTRREKYEEASVIRDALNELKAKKQ